MYNSRRYSWKIARFRLDIRNDESGETLEQFTREVDDPTAEVFKVWLDGSLSTLWTSNERCPCIWQGGLDYMIFKGLSQPKLFYDSLVYFPWKKNILPLFPSRFRNFKTLQEQKNLLCVAPEVMLSLRTNDLTL